VSGGFAKIYATILDSSVWGEAPATRVVWITLLAMADADGRVEASVGGLARRAQVTREECDAALGIFLAPDPDDKSGVDDGRRIRICDRGWCITNHRYYRDLQSPKQVADAERARRYRERQRNDHHGTPVTSHKQTPNAEAEADTNAEAEAEGSGEGSPRAPSGKRTRSPKGSRPHRARQAPHPLPEDWRPSSKQVEALASKWGASEAQIRALVPEFIWYWTEGQGTGKRRAETGWQRTFGNHVDRQGQREFLTARAGAPELAGATDDDAGDDLADASNMSAEKFYDR